MDQRSCDVDELVEAIQGVDLESADGRAGLGALLRELERTAPDALRRVQAHTLREQRALGARLFR
jgi:hypothetical protein